MINLEIILCNLELHTQALDILFKFISEKLFPWNSKDREKSPVHWQIELKYLISN